VEYFNGSVFVSLAPGGAVNYTVDNFTGTGAQTTFTMSKSAANVDQIIVFIGSIYQDPQSAYTLSGGGYDINFTSAPPNTMPINVIHTNS
jgi:stress response protein SCP2